MAVKKGTSGDDTLYGWKKFDRLFGGAGDDVLYGGKGDDYVWGGAGDDTIIGNRFDDDRIIGGKGIDTLDYSKCDEGLGIDFEPEYYWAGYVAKTINGRNMTFDYFRGIEVFILSEGSDSFNTYKTVPGMTIFGGGGYDFIQGFGGLMRGDDGEDYLVGHDAHSETFWLQRGMGADEVVRFKSGQDSIRLGGDDFDLGATVEEHEIVYTDGDQSVVGDSALLIWDDATEELYYDPDGGGTDSAELIATFLYSSDHASYLDFEIV